MYIYRVVGHGIPRFFYKQFEDRERAKEGIHGRQGEFRFHDLVMFFAAAAASGVIGNLAYDAVRKAIQRVRKPGLEIASKGIHFGVVVSRKTYNRVRHEKNPGIRALRSSTPKFEEKLESEYRLMVSLSKKRKG